MTSLDIAAHLEDIDHEISGLESKVPYQGYRVDGPNGIKNVVKLAKRKSVDYFYLANRQDSGNGQVSQPKCDFIEFTDLVRGQMDRQDIPQLIPRYRRIGRARLSYF